MPHTPHHPQASQASSLSSSGRACSPAELLNSAQEQSRTTFSWTLLIHLSENGCHSPLSLLPPWAGPHLSISGLSVLSVRQWEVTDDGEVSGNRLCCNREGDLMYSRADADYTLSSSSRMLCMCSPTINVSSHVSISHHYHVS